MATKLRRSSRQVKGKVNGGVIIPEPGARLPEGADVRIQLLAPPRRKGQTPRIMRHAGTATSLPPDASLNLEHYLYGHPKR